MNVERIKENIYEINAQEILDGLVQYILGLPDGVDEEDIKKILIWVNDYLSIQNNSWTYNYQEIPDLKRGNIILAKFGENFGKEFSGKHYAIVLRDCKQGIDQILVLPITSKKPKAYDSSKKGIYLEIPKIDGFPGFYDDNNPNHPDTGKHWANILSIRNISKQRVIYPSNIFEVDGSVLTAISATVKSKIALR